MPNNFNPRNIVQMIRNGSNPQQIMMYYLQSSLSNSPFGENLINLAKNNDTKEIEKIARNLCAQRGIDFDTEFNAFKRNLGL